MLNVQCHEVVLYAQCRNAECRSAECHGAIENDSWSCNLLISLLCQHVSNRAKKLYRIAPSISDLIIVLTWLKKF
jgi:hypothetical protein